MIHRKCDTNRAPPPPAQPWRTRRSCLRSGTRRPLGKNRHVWPPIADQEARCLSHARRTAGRCATVSATPRDILESIGETAAVLIPRRDHLHVDIGGRETLGHKPSLRLRRLIHYPPLFHQGTVRENRLESCRGDPSRRPMKNPSRYFNSSPEVIRLAVMMYVRFPLSLRQVEDLLFERGIDVCHETVRFWWNRFVPMFAAEIRRCRARPHRCYSRWRRHLDEVFVKINGEAHYLWRAVDQEGEVLEVFATKRRDRGAALKFLKRTMKRYGRPRDGNERWRCYIGAGGKSGELEWQRGRTEPSRRPSRDATRFARRRWRSTR